LLNSAFLIFCRKIILPKVLGLVNTDSTRQYQLHSGSVS
jgi:hypothetical protein